MLSTTQILFYFPKSGERMTAEFHVRCSCAHCSRCAPAWHCESGALHGSVHPLSLQETFCVASEHLRSEFKGSLYWGLVRRGSFVKFLGKVSKQTELFWRGKAKASKVLTKKTFFCLKGAPAVAESRQSEPVTLFPLPSLPHFGGKLYIRESKATTSSSRWVVYLTMLSVSPELAPEPVSYGKASSLYADTWASEWIQEITLRKRRVMDSYYANFNLETNKIPRNFSGTEGFVINKAPYWKDCWNCDGFNVKGTKVLRHKEKSKCILQSRTRGIKSMLRGNLWGRNVTLGRSQSQVRFDSSKYKGDNLARTESREFATKLTLFIRFCWSKSKMQTRAPPAAQEGRAETGWKLLEERAAALRVCVPVGMDGAASMSCVRCRLQAERCSRSFYCPLVLTVNNKGSWKSIFLAKMNLQWLGCF